jgi:DNA primase
VYQDVRREESFVLVEGYLDVLALWQAGVHHALAPLGTAVTHEQIRRLKRYAPTGKLLFDADEAGIRAAERTILLCEQQDLSTEVVRLEPGKDPAEILEKQGSEALQKSLESTISSFQFYLSTAHSKFDSRTPDGKRAVIRHLGSYLTSLDSQVKRDGYIRLLAEDLGVDFESVRSDLLRGTERSRTRDDSYQRPEALGVSADLFFILAVAVNRDYFQEVRNTVAVDDLEDPRARKVFVALEECYRQGERTEEALLRRFGEEDEPLRNLLLEKTASGEFTFNTERLIEDGLRQIRRRSLEKRRRFLISALSRAKQQDAVKELLGEKMYLDEELQKLSER